METKFQETEEGKQWLMELDKNFQDFLKTEKGKEWSKKLRELKDYREELNNFKGGGTYP